MGDEWERHANAPHPGEEDRDRRRLLSATPIRTTVFRSRSDFPQGEAAGGEGDPQTHPRHHRRIHPGQPREPSTQESSQRQHTHRRRPSFQSFPAHPHSSAQQFQPPQWGPPPPHPSTSYPGQQPYPMPTVGQFAATHTQPSSSTTAAHTSQHQLHPQRQGHAQLSYSPIPHHPRSYSPLRTAQSQGGGPTETQSSINRQYSYPHSYSPSDPSFSYGQGHGQHAQQHPRGQHPHPAAPTSQGFYGASTPGHPPHGPYPHHPHHHPTPSAHGHDSMQPLPPYHYPTPSHAPSSVGGIYRTSTQDAAFTPPHPHHHYDPPQQRVSYDTSTPSPPEMATRAVGEEVHPHYHGAPPHPPAPVGVGGGPPHGHVPPEYVYLTGEEHGATEEQQQQQQQQPDDLILELHEADVLCGRGAPTTYHAGNHFFKELVAKYQPTYIASRRSDKPQIAAQIVKIVRERGGRFLKRTKRPGLGPSGHFAWEDVGDQRAYEKACQALRENAPEIRRRLASQELAAISVDSDQPSAVPRVSDESSKKRSPSHHPGGEDDDDEYQGRQSSLVSPQDQGGVERRKRARSD